MLWSAKGSKHLGLKSNTYEMSLERVDNHPRCCLNYVPSHFLLQLDYLEFIDIYHCSLARRVLTPARPSGGSALPSADSVTWSP